MDAGIVIMVAAIVFGVGRFWSWRQQSKIWDDFEASIRERNAGIVARMEGKER